MWLYICICNCSGISIRIFANEFDWPPNQKQIKHKYEMFHRFLFNSSGISRLSGKLTDLFSSRGSKARSKFSFHYFFKAGSKSHNLCICVYFCLCDYCLTSFSVYVIVHLGENVHLCVFVCSFVCHVSLLERYKPSAFVYFCLCCGADMFFGILKLVPTSQ